MTPSQPRRRSPRRRNLMPVGIGVAGAVVAAAVISTFSSVGSGGIPRMPAAASQPTIGSTATRSATAAAATAAASSSAAGTGVDHVVVSDAAGLQRALAQARPGTTIQLSDGVYDGQDVKDPSGKEPGRFVATAAGTAAAPIVLTGSRRAVLEGGGTGGGYALHLAGAQHWKVAGFTVRSAAKGIVLDHADFNVLDDLHVTDIGAEGVHFRSFSSDNLLTDSTVDHTGTRSPNYGEGVYIGSARSNWPTYTDGRPDRSDRNRIVRNTIVAPPPRTWT